jgi:chromosome partitioning protein
MRPIDTSELGNKVSAAAEAKPQLPISMDEIASVADRADALAHEIRARVMAPDVRKVAPVYMATQAIRLSGVANDSACATRAGSAARQRRVVTVADARSAARCGRPAFMRPPSSRAITIAVANFKGGVGKTTTAMALAQGLSLHGHKVLAIDLDPQGSLSTLFGIVAQTEVNEAMTALPLLRGECDDLLPVARATYWDGVDLVPAAPMLFAAEFAIPSRQAQSSGASFWTLLDRGLASARVAYDVIVIDTPPALSYLTINALMAADGIVVPTPPTALDFASLAHFWQLFADFRGNAEFVRGGGKRYAFIHVLLTRVDQSDVAMPAVRGWINAAYGEFVLAAEVPKSTVAPAMAAAFGTAYDIGAYEGARATYRRIIDAYAQVTACIEHSVVDAWKALQQGDLETEFPRPSGRADACSAR